MDQAIAFIANLTYILAIILITIYLNQIYGNVSDIWNDSDTWK